MIICHLNCCSLLTFVKPENKFCFPRTSNESSRSTEGMGTAERTFLTPKNTQTNLSTNVPSLDEFDAEIEIYRVSLLTHICLVDLSILIKWPGVLII